MHILDGMLPAQLCVGGYAITGGVTWYVLKRINRMPQAPEELPKAALLTAAFFVGSSINIPLPPASVHLLLNGLLGALLGWYAWPAILVGLLLQALLLGHGGLTTLGVNAVLIGIPALIAYGVYQLRGKLLGRLPHRWSLGIFAYLAGAVGLGLSALIFLSLIVFSIPDGLDAATERQALIVMLFAHLPMIVLEGTFTTLLALFLQKVKPELVH